jgi:TolB-like protein
MRVGASVLNSVLGRRLANQERAERKITAFEEVPANGPAERNTDVPPTSRIEFRIGVNVGDVVVEDGDIFGDCVNVAARLEGLADPGGICVSARVQEDAAGRLGLPFEDLGEQALKNIARSVRVYRVRLTAAGNTPESVPIDATRLLPLPDKPSIAVLPFANMSGDPEQEYFADGMVEEIITALSRIRWLFVIARNSSFTYKGKAVDVKQRTSGGSSPYLLDARCWHPQRDCRSTIRGGGNRLLTWHQMPTERMGPPPGASPPMRMTASWSGSKRTCRIQVWRREAAPQWRAPLGLIPRTSVARRRSSGSPSPVIILPRAQASKPAPGLNRGRCETQATLSGKPLSCAMHFGPLTPSARSGNLIAGERPFRSKQGTGNKQKTT